LFVCLCSLKIIGAFIVVEIEDRVPFLLVERQRQQGGLTLLDDVVFGAKEYAMRDSNPQPPDSKSDTLSIAPTAPPKRLLTHQQTTTKPNE
jgi:hypothetical protein